MIIFDTETTDLVKSVDLPLKVLPRVIELYAIRVNNDTFAIEEEFDHLFYPDQKVSDLITKITSITNDMLRGKPKFSTLVEAFNAMTDGDDYGVGHNVCFDRDMLLIENRFIRASGASNTQIRIPPKLICTVEQTEHLCGRRLNLRDLHQHLFGKSFDAAHRARADVMATYRCTVELIERGIIKL